MSAMKVIFIFSLVNFATFVVQCEVIVPGIPVKETLTKPSQSSWFARDSAKNGTTCGNTLGPKCKDCHTVINCVGGDSPVSSVNCAEKNPKTPYCFHNQCSATPSNPSCVPKTKFLCTGEGYYPDPDKCTRYYICSETGEDHAAAYECPQSYVYKSKARGCAKKCNDTDCATVDCSKTPNEFGVYLKDPAYYYLCQKDKTSSRTVMMKCPDEKNMQFDSKLGKCAFRCPAEGNFVNVLDCTKYYYCYSVASGFQVDELKCPAGLSFDPRTLMCVKTSSPCKPQVLPPTTTTPATTSQRSSSLKPVTFKARST